MLTQKIHLYVVLLILLSGLVGAQCFAAGSHNEIKIGFLAHRGVDRARTMWQPTLNYLAKEIPGYHFILIPLTNDDVHRVVEQGQIDFLLTNPASYVVVEGKYGLSRIATVRKRDKQASYTVFGSVIFTKADRNDINSLSDLVGKSYMGVHRNGFGGWWMAWREFKSQGIDPYQAFSRLRFSGFPQAKVVHAVLKGEVDAGNVRTGIMESMAKSGQINLADIKVLNEQKSVFFSAKHSTRLYPEWPLAVLKHVPYELTQRLALALFSMESQHEAAIAAGIAGWTIPLDYKPVHDLMKELAVGRYQNSELSLSKVVAGYWHWLAIIVASISALSTLLLVFLRLNQKLAYSNDDLQKEVLERELLQDKLRYQAQHDSLTELPNRMYFNESIHKAIGKGSEMAERFAVAIIDLDHFKEVNDRMGHQVGDRLLQQVAKRLYSSVREGDTIARLGGDEFAIIMEVNNPEDSINVAKKILKNINTPLQIEGKKLIVGASMGIAQYPNHGRDVDNLLRNADVAMYEAKRSGVHLMLYDTKFDDDYELRLNFQSEIRDAFFEKESFEVYYQPRVDSKTLKTSCLEAMVRWNHPQRGIILPEEFIHVIEDLGLMDRLTITVIRKILEDFSKWPATQAKIPISINISARALIIPGLPEKILSMLISNDYLPANLEIEIGNWSHNNSLSTLVNSIEKLSSQGVILSVDNFGETSIPFSYFSKLPISGIKMDRSLVSDIDKNKAKRDIVEATIVMAHRLDLWITAAGIEKKESWDLLKRIGADFGQGYYLSRPLPIQGILVWLENPEIDQDFKSAS